MYNFLCTLPFYLPFTFFGSVCATSLMEFRNSGGTGTRNWWDGTAGGGARRSIVNSSLRLFRLWESSLIWQRGFGKISPKNLRTIYLYILPRKQKGLEAENHHYHFEKEHHLNQIFMTFGFPKCSFSDFWTRQSVKSCEAT